MPEYKYYKCANTPMYTATQHKALDSIRKETPMISDHLAETHDENSKNATNNDGVSIF
ncbi:uncharacterized protein An15g00430 [Aspergillus niger]|uniref:Contig An15c0030, genomic contig n=2 Tax=Aspergillus niger TaxID=5061 RepID=A2R4H4_ASPNC|nr:uncharacterized protein An15g00430 [Aspergillus niger]CAK42212.1 unnamed protein product [Aspergillus niger]